MAATKRRSQPWHLLLLLLFLVASPFAISTTPSISSAPASSPGKWELLQDLNSTHVGHIATFAVSEINHRTNGDYVFSTLLSGELLRAHGTHYNLKIEVVKDPPGRVYIFMVGVYENNGHLTLTSYALVAEGPPRKPPMPPELSPVQPPVPPPEQPPVAPPSGPPNSPSPAGPWKAIVDTNTPSVQRAAVFAITAINEKEQDHWPYTYIHVASGETQGVADGVKYRLMVRVLEGFRAFRTLQAVVQEKSQGLRLELVSYNLMS